MKATDYIKMPERIDNIYEVGMNDKEMKIYRKRLEKGNVIAVCRR